VNERDRAKQEWVANARLNFRPSQRQNCYVCGKFGFITHAHHTVPLSEQFERKFKAPFHEHAWLCPNHHAILHVLINPAKDTLALGHRAFRVIDDLEREELKTMLELVGLSGQGEPEE
jgi:hypothetical protein